MADWHLRAKSIMRDRFRNVKETALVEAAISAGTSEQT
jgi:hypothetical protein